jgi:hypothetical protein
MDFIKKSLYKNKEIILTTKHKKSDVIAPVFQEILGAKIIEVDLDTDQLGTFTGEIERKSNPIECAEKKCLWGIQEKVMPFGLANEGSFGPSPIIPFINSNQEIICFIDKEKKIKLFAIEIFHKTNFQRKTITTHEELLEFSNKALFPTHGIIVKPEINHTNHTLFKGITNFDNLYNAFNICKNISSSVIIETDMRAYVNPTRMKNIETVAIKMAEKLLQLCSSCHTPGWDIIDTQIGLPCELCNSETDMIQAYIWGCQKCPNTEKLHSKNKKAEALYCNYCNP